MTKTVLKNNSTRELLTLDAAITLLESDTEIAEFQVDLGSGCIVKIKPDSGLLQRMVGHRLLAAIANGAADISSARRPADNDMLWIAPEVRNLLDVLKPR